MSKKVLLIIVSIVVVIGAGVIYLLSNNKAEAPEETVSQTTVQQEQAEPIANNNQSQAEPSKQAGEYLAFSEQAFNSSTNQRILFFHAPWCPQCRDLDKDISANTVPAGVTIFKTDFDSSQDLKKKYGVTQQTTVVLVDSSGNLVKKFVAYDSPTLNSVINNLL